MGRSPGPSDKQSRILEHDSRDPETEIGSFEIKKGVHRIHDTLETGLHMMLRSLVAPTRGAGGRREALGVYGGGGTFYAASRREEKGEGLGEERVRDSAAAEAGG